MSGLQEVALQFLVSSVPFLARDRIAKVVFPHALDLEEPRRGSLLAKAELLDHPAAPLVAGHDHCFHAVQPELLEAIPDDERDTLGDVATTGVLRTDPVSDEARLERPAQHAAQTDLADERVVA